LNIFEKIFFTKSNWALGLYIDNDLKIKHINKPSFEIYNITDCKARGIADPFLIEYNNEIYIFFEIEKWIDKKNNKIKGVIGAAKLINDKLKYLGIVLEENFHLSFPFIFKYQNNIFMLPESSKNKKLILYKCKNFPFKWEKYKILLNGNFIDSILFFKDKWYLITLENNIYTNMYISNSLDKDFIFHKTLYKKNKTIGRNGGYIEGIRIAQDCYTTYGKQLHFLKYKNECEEYINSFSPSCGYKWDSTNIHHFNAIKIDNKFYHIYDAKGYQLRIKRFFKRLLNAIRSDTI